MLEAAKDLSEGLESYRLLLATVGIPLLTLFITVYVSGRNTKLSPALKKIAEMRQVWINNPRDQMVEYSSICIDRHVEGHADIRELSRIDGKIILLMDIKDIDFIQLTEKMKFLSRAAIDQEIDSKSVISHHNAYITTCQGILKRE